MKSRAAYGLLLGTLGLTSGMLFSGRPEATARGRPARVAAAPRAPAEDAPTAESAPLDPDDRLRRMVTGTWTDNYQGKRTMTLKADGTGDMVVELSGLKAASLLNRYLRNAKGAMIYEGSNEIQSLIQADYALGKRRDKKLQMELPPYDHESWT